MLKSVLGCWLVACVAVGAALGSQADPSAYAGSERCRSCDVEMYDGWKDTFQVT